MALKSFDMGRYLWGVQKLNTFLNTFHSNFLWKKIFYTTPLRAELTENKIKQIIDNEELFLFFGKSGFNINNHNLILKLSNKK